METLRLSGKNSNKLFLLDDEDLKNISKYKWYLNKYGYVVRNRRFKNGKWDNYPTKIHRIVLNVNDPMICIDHINGNKLDNRKSNLRICTIQQNNFKRNKKKDNTSGYKGIHKHKSGKWMVRISAYNKRYYFGLYEDIKEANAVYNKECKRLHKDFAIFNE